MIPNVKHNGDILTKLYANLAEYAIPLVTFSENTEYKSESFSFLPLISDGRYASYFVTLGEEKILFMPSGIMNTESADFLASAISEADTLILGKYGTQYSHSFYLDGYYDNLNSIVFSGEGIYLTPDIASRYKENGCKLISHPSLYKLFN
jgi:hypothetical protein